MSTCRETATNGRPSAPQNTSTNNSNNSASNSSAGNTNSNAKGNGNSNANSSASEALSSSQFIEKSIVTLEQNGEQRMTEVLSITDNVSGVDLVEVFDQLTNRIAVQTAVVNKTRVEENKVEETRRLSSLLVVCKQVVKKIVTYDPKTGRKMK